MSEAIRSILDGSGAPLRHFADIQTVGSGLAALYSPAAMPLWTDEGRPTSQASAAVAFLRHADDEGLVPEDYDAAWLAQQHVKDPARLAEFVLSETPGWTPERIAAAMNGTRTVRISVSPPIPVFISYTTAIVRADETVEFFDDIYGLDAPLDRALAAAEHR
jgi:murein L,D-transpeptidase YcbB/YkuD